MASSDARDALTTAEYRDGTVIDLIKGIDG